MKQRLFCMTGILGAALVCVTLFGGCDLLGGGGKSGGGGPDYGIYQNFYNYPAGRTSPSGTLTIAVETAGQFLIFADAVTPAHYLGTANGISDTKVAGLSEGPHTIIVVAKAAYEEHGTDAAKASRLSPLSGKIP